MSDRSTSIKVTLKVTSFIIRILLNAIFYIVLIFAIIHVSKQAFQFAYQLYGPAVVDANAKEDIYIKVNKGDTTMEVASKLELNRVIVNKHSFFWKVKLQKDVIMAGTYRLNASMTYDEILDTISDYKNSIIQDEDDE